MAIPLDLSCGVLNVVAVTYSVVTLYEIMTDSTGMGETGESYIIDEEGYMLTPSRFIEDAVLNRQIDIAATQDAHNAPEGCMVDVITSFSDYRGVEVINAHVHLPELGWIVIAEMNKTEAFASVSQLTQTGLWVLLGLCGFGAITAFTVSRRMTSPIQRLRQGTEAIMEGNLDYRTEIKSKDEIGQLSRAFDTMASELKESTDKLEEHARTLELKVRERTSDLEEANTTMEEEIVERKRAEEALAESEEKYRFITENVRSIIAMSDMEGNYIYVNDSYERELGFSREEILGKSSLEFIHPDDRESMTQAFLESMEKGSNWFEDVLCFRMRAKDGSYRWMEINGRFLQDANGSFEGITIVATDITERKQAEEELANKMHELEESEKATLNIMEDLQETISSLKKTQQELSEKNEELIAAEEEQRQLTAALEEQNRLVVDAQQDLFEALDRTVSSERELRSKHEQLLVAEGKLLTINSQLEERVTERTSEVSKLLQQKESFISQLAHDLRNPLTPLVALLPILEQKQNDEKAKNIVAMAVRNVDYMEDLVNKTVQLAKLNSTNAVTFEIVDINLSSLVQGLVERQKICFDDAKITTRITIDERITVAADKLQLTEVFTNLSNNAVKFMPENGTLTLDAREDNGFAIVSITDTGIGITKDQAEHIFDEFYKADQSRHELGSAGLGLTICKRIIEKHGGRIWAESEGEGKGTTFRFTIPLAQQGNQQSDQFAQEIEVLLEAQSQIEPDVPERFNV